MSDKHSPFLAPFYRLVHLLCVLVLPTALATAGSFDRDFERLDQRFQDLSADLYRAYAALPDPQPPIDSLQQLEQRVRAVLQTGHTVAGISLLTRHRQLILDNMDDRRMADLVALLLDYNAWQTAADIYTHVKAEGEKSLVSSLSFIFARHHLQRNQWQQTIDTLAGTYEDLAEENASYARLITGIAHQKLKRHRQALDYYQKVPATSDYYIFAQLNTAIAYIRQGWWTDAQAAIRASLTNPQANRPDEMVNRLHLVLGYSMLQHEYYRNARDAFRNISLDSRYTNRALLGLALSAANQEDYIGALNALSILKDKDARDLSVDECYLLFPFIYKKLNQQMTASATYSEAMNYYQARIMEIDSILLSLENSGFSPTQISEDNTSISINNNTLDYARHYPVAFLGNLKRLHDMQQVLQREKPGISARLLRRTDGLLDEHKALYQKIVGQLFSERQEYLRSYLNQSRYGLANLYDSSILNEN